ncbi:type I restriction-modification system subunit M [Tissierella praeacuta]|uniref:type I restriction-modification system subunit M n=1 Tax=Tissierella praeacuta TaxID=43131 RepID=UPI001FD366A0|nr:class I SAM-dependent DNA methyltransferase [Tissierella praeacuta]
MNKERGQKLMTITSLIKSIQDIMRQDAGVDGDAQRISQLVWMLFLKVYDAKEAEWEIFEENYKSIIPEDLRWRNWAEDEEGMTGDELLEFVNERLFKELKDLTVDENTDKRALIVKSVFEDSYNYMKSGTLLRQLINKLNEIDFDEYEDRHAFNDIYENILRDLQSAGNAGEYYTPRVLTEFIIDILNPQIGEKIADFACGTGGFLVSSLNHLEKQTKTIEDRKIVQSSLFGIEKKPLPHLLCMTNLLLHDLDSPNILRDNSLSSNIRDYTEKDKYDLIAMNPPFGGVEEVGIQINFPTEFRTSETADLFMALIMYRLKENGRAGVILPDGFLFGNDNAKIAIKEKLLSEFNLHTIVRVPNGVFAPYTSIATNILFFDKTKSTEKIDYYQVPLPEGIKNGFTKTRPFRTEHLQGVKDWWNNRDKEDINAYSVTIEEIKKANYNLDFKNPNLNKEEKQYSLNELLSIMDTKSKNINKLIGQLSEVLKGVEE